APEADIDEAARPLDLHRRQRLELQALAGGEYQVIERADALEQRTHLRLVGDVDDLALRTPSERCERAVEALLAARCDDDRGTLALRRLGGGKPDARRAAENHHAFAAQAHACLLMRLKMSAKIHLSFCFARDLFRKPVPTFRDHALAGFAGFRLGEPA